ncbi:hypothetical protein HOA92_04650 [archaeon]|jgi:hypothetical protein|nr:hypothetical protein [archaeon]MBT6762306.1 hypothetical protein [archaeon]
MVSRPEKIQATKFICDLLEASGKYDIQRVDYRQITVNEKNHVRREPRKIQVIMANIVEKFSNYQKQLEFNKRRNFYTAPVLYKDGKTAFVRAAENNPWRTGSTLKDYNKQQANQILGLRKVEKETLDLLGTTLTYYQPKSDRLPESIRLFDMGQVTFDYSHIRPGHGSFGHVSGTKVSKMLKFPNLISSEESVAEFKYLLCNSKLARINSV